VKRRTSRRRTGRPSPLSAMSADTARGRGPPRGSPSAVELGSAGSRAPLRSQGLGRQSEMLRVIFDNIPVMISVRDSSGRLQLVNREWERVIGWTLEEAQARGNDLFRTLYPDSKHREKVLETMQNGHSGWRDFQPRTRDGTTIETSWAQVALSDGTRISIGQDIRERKRSEEALRMSEERFRQSSAELRALSERLRVVREEEAARIAREVHDEVGQALTALKMDVSWLKRKADSSAGRLPEGSPPKLQAMAELIDATLVAVHRIATELRPGVLDELGLEAAIEWYVREFEKRTAISCRVLCALNGAAVETAKATAVFRILQEALTNVARHAAATRVEIRLAARAGILRLEVRDNGRGIPRDRLANSWALGLLGMRERAHALSGDVSVARSPGGGTSVTTRLPL
jgi:PAS domain S-box-containing protein